MIKKFLYVILFFCVLVFIKFFVSSYSISYTLGDFKIKEFSDSDVMYFEISYEDNVYNYMFYNGRKLTKKRVKDVKVKEVNDGFCLTPIIKGMDSYSVCSDGTGLVSKSVLENDRHEFSSTEDFYYADSLGKDEYVLIWKYDGFYYMNADEQKSINIFDKDRYSNDLMFQKDKYLIFPKYGDDYLFSEFVVLDMVKGSYKSISSEYKINYNSKVVGEHNNSIYIFDFTSNKLYEVNYKKRRCKLIGDEIKGYVKYVNGKKKSASKDDYVKDKYTFFEDDINYVTVDKNFYFYNINPDIRFKYFYDDNVKVIDNYEDNLYFVSGDNLLRFSNDGVDMVVHYFEFNFNNGNIVFVYNK